MKSTFEKLINAFIKLVDVKSFITIGLVTTLIIIVVRDIPIEEKVFNLFSNLTTMVMTYFFTRPNKNKPE